MAKDLFYASPDTYLFGYWSIEGKVWDIRGTVLSAIGSKFKLERGNAIEIQLRPSFISQINKYE